MPVRVLRREMRLFFTALTFYSRLPGLRLADATPAGLNGATRYFPAVGWIVGGIAAAVFWGGHQLVPPPVAVVLAMIATVWVTGAFHEDALADSCDGFGGGWDRDQILAIMKDSRSGAYGVVGTVLNQLLKYSALLALPASLLPAALIAAHGISRFAAVGVMARLPYVRGNNRSKIRPIAQGISRGQVLVAALFGLAPLLLLPPPMGGALLPVLVAHLGLVRFFRRRLGGYTGDCLGATQQVGETAFYLGLVAIWTSISSATPASR